MLHNPETRKIWTIVLAVIFSGFIFSVKLCQAQEKLQISEIAIQISSMPSHPWESIARDIIPIKKMDMYSLEKIEQAISRLVESNLFESVHVDDPKETPQGIRLSFVLVPFGRIKDIIIQKAFPLFQKEVLNAMNIYTGDIFVEERLKEQSERITLLFKDQGYINPHIKVSATKDVTDGNYIVQITIQKGEFYKISSINFKGNDNIATALLKLRISSWKSSVLFFGANRFTQKALDEDVKNFISFYRQKGYADVLVDTQIQKDDSTLKVNILFDIKEGPKYEISFQGNNNIFDHTLNKEVALLFKDGNKNNFGLRRSMRNLKRLYTEKGYLDSAIEKQIIDNDPENPSLKKIILKIDEGMQYLVTRLSISGNPSISEKELMKSILTKPGSTGVSGNYVPSVLEADIGAVRALYLQKGFTQVMVEKKIQINEDPFSDKIRQKSVDINIAIKEGVKTHVGVIAFDNLTVLTKDKALSMIKLKSGMEFNKSLIEADEQQLVQKISEAGYPHAKVKVLTNFTDDYSQVNLTYQVTPGPTVTVGQIFFAGNFRTRNETLANEMEITTGDPLLLSRLLKSHRNILDIESLDSAKLRTIGLKTVEDEVDVIVEVSEKKPYVFEAGAGYDTERQLYVNTLIGDHNFLGRNLALQSGAEISQIGYKANVSLTDPRFFSTNVASTTRLFTEDQAELNKDFGSIAYGASQDFSKPFFNDKVMTSLGFVYEYREQYLEHSQLLTEEEKELYSPRQIFVTSPSLIFRTTDSFVRPKKGIFSSIDVDISKGLENDIDDFIKYRLDVRYYYTPFEPLTLAVRGRYGFIQLYGNNTRIPEDQLFYLGGTSTVRGFEENLLRTDASGQALGGREAILGSLEARYDLGKNLEATMFYDIGKVSTTQENDTSESFRDSVGIGLRYITPIGPIGILYGHKLDPQSNESAGCFHFSLGYTF